MPFQIVFGRAHGDKSLQERLIRESRSVSWNLRYPDQPFALMVPAHSVRQKSGIIVGKIKSVLFIFLPVRPFLSRLFEHVLRLQAVTGGGKRR
ncbi:MAG: hypothetical protein U5K76_05915 [Woeseiaceae bacterium]|nr:hypothetical protein [Woeseiaceae bacterium]